MADSEKCVVVFIRLDDHQLDWEQFDTLELATEFVDNGQDHCTARSGMGKACILVCGGVSKIVSCT